MGQYALIVAAAGMIGGAVLLFGVVDDSGQVGRDLTLHQAHWSSRELALTGLELTVERLARDAGTGWTGTGYGIAKTEVGSGAIQTTIRPINSDTIDVVAVGFQGYYDKRGVWRDTLTTVDARYERATTDGGDPPAFRNAITSGDDLYLNGRFSVSSYVEGVSADIHTNGTLTTDGGAYSIDGYGWYVEGEAINHNGFSDPNDGDLNAPDYGPGEYIDIKPLDIEQIMAEPGARVVPPELLTDGVLQFGVGVDQESISIPEWAAANGMGDGLGTAAMPLFLLVPDGNILFENQVNISGYASFIAYRTNPDNLTTGNITVKPLGSDGGVIGGIDASNENMLGLMTSGEFVMSGNGTIVATIFAENVVVQKGTPTIMGSIVSRNSFTGKGTPTVIYVGASKKIIGPPFDYRLPVGPVLIAYSEW